MTQMRMRPGKRRKIGWISTWTAKLMENLTLLKLVNKSSEGLKMSLNGVAKMSFQRWTPTKLG